MLRRFCFLELNIETVLEALGSHFIKYISNIGYDKILKGLGNNLHDFLSNIDYLHEHFLHVYPGLKGPSIRVSHSNEGSMQLQYHSQRKGNQRFLTVLKEQPCFV